MRCVKREKLSKVATLATVFAVTMFRSWTRYRSLMGLCHDSETCCLALVRRDWKIFLCILLNDAEVDGPETQKNLAVMFSPTNLV